MEIQRIGSIGAITSTLATGGVSGASVAAGAGGGDVGRTFTDLLSRLSQTEHATDNLVVRAASGEDVDLHDVMIATQAESLAFQVGLQVRNKLVEAYQEIFRMQV